jgi:NAD(P)-dependent dehydrogenase (short-subunit alcohol dehydrogenase family)/SAM-dependent methyltransferase
MESLSDRSLSLNDLLCKVLSVQLFRADFPKTPATPSAIRSSLGIIDQYDRWFEWSLHILAEKGYICEHQGQYHLDRSAPDKAEIEQEWEIRQLEWSTDLSLKPQIALLNRTLPHLTDVLTGQLLSTELLFPEGSMSLVEGVYKDNPTAEYFNGILASTVRRYVEQRVKRDSSAQIRILEVGAGTGAATKPVLSELRPHFGSLAEYCYSDLSQAFLAYGRRAFKRDCPFMQFRLIDLEKPMPLQDVEHDAYDVILASNSLHATRSIRATLRNLKTTLRTNGLLLMNEISDARLFAHLTFGLLRGWWVSQDEPIRIPGCPGLTSHSWKRVLESEGFRFVSFPSSRLHHLGQQVILAESDGVVRESPHRTETAQQAGQILSDEQASDVRRIGASELTYRELHNSTIAASDTRPVDDRLHAFSTTLASTVFFLSDHVVGGKNILPAAAYLEIVCNAALRARGLPVDSIPAGDWNQVIVLTEVLWSKPLIVEIERTITTEVERISDNEFVFRVLCPEVDGAGKAVSHSQGRCTFGAPESPKILDIARLKEECREQTLSAHQSYELLNSWDLVYGPAQRGILRMNMGRGATGHRQILAEIEIPASIATQSDNSYVLHPSVMDSALQACAGLILSDSTPPTGAMLPFAVDEARIFAPTPSKGWALLREMESADRVGSIPKVSIDICDTNGHVCVELKGFTMLSTSRGKDIAPLSPISKPDVEDRHEEKAFLTPIWEETQVRKTSPWPAVTEKAVIVLNASQAEPLWRRIWPQATFFNCDESEDVSSIFARLRDLPQIDHFIFVAPENGPDFSVASLISQQNEGALQLFRVIKAVVQAGYSDKRLGWTVVTTLAQAVREGDEIRPAHASIHGLVGSMAKEFSDWQIRLVDLPASPSLEVAVELINLPPDPKGNAWAYRSGQWYRQRLFRTLMPDRLGAAYKSKGVYVVVGGAGGIGMVWSENMIRKYQARIIWIGRRPLDTHIQTKLDFLATLGAAPHYIEADATDRDSLRHAYEKIRSMYSRLDGIVHSAMVLADKTLLSMDEDRFQAALAAKVNISVNMLEVFGNEPLNLILFFSSLQSFLKYPGQSNYAAGCTFMDAFARWLGRSKHFVRVVNWGFWGSVGAVASPHYRAKMARLGFASIEAPDGMEALEHLVDGPRSQLAFVEMTQPFSQLADLAIDTLRVYPDELPSISLRGE